MGDKTPEGSGEDVKSDPREHSDDATEAKTDLAETSESETPEEDEKESAEEESELLPIERKTAKAPVRKAAPTRKRADTEKPERDPYGPTNPVEFTKQSVGELKKVVWPTWAILTSYFFAVLVFVLFVIAFVGLLDMFFGWGLLTLLGDAK